MAGRDETVPMLQWPTSTGPLCQERCPGARWCIEHRRVPLFQNYATYFSESIRYSTNTKEFVPLGRDSVGVTSYRDGLDTEGSNFNRLA